MLKKMIVLATAVAAFAAFAIPASASAANLQWQHNEVPVKAGQEFNESFEGPFYYVRAEGIGTFQCNVTSNLRVTGPEKAEITEFSPQLSSCHGTEKLVKCTLTANVANVPWTITNGVKNLTATKPGGNMTWASTYGGYECPLFGPSTREWASLTITPSGIDPIRRLTWTGTARNGLFSEGSFTPVGNQGGLGLK